MKVAALALLALPALSLADFVSTGNSPHRQDRSGISKTQQKKDSIGRAPCHRGINKHKVEGEGKGWLETFGLGGGGGGRLKKGPAPKLWSGVVDEWKRPERNEELAIGTHIYVVAVEELGKGGAGEVKVETIGYSEHHGHGHAHAHGGGRRHHKHSFAQRLERAIDQLEPAEAGFLSFVFGFGFMSLFGMLFTIARRLVDRRKACKARRAAVPNSPPAYIASSVVYKDEKVVLDVSPAVEQVALLEHE